MGRTQETKGEMRRKYQGLRSLRALGLKALAAGSRVDVFSPPRGKGRRRIEAIRLKWPIFLYH